MSIPIRSLVGVGLSLAITASIPATAAASPRAGGRPHKKEARATTRDGKRSCAKPPVEVVAATESATFSLAKCDGAAEPAGVDRLSSLAGAHGGLRLDAKLVERLELAVEHLRKGPEPARVVLVSGYRPRSAGSYHSTGRALDFRIEGVANEAIVAFCKTLADTGCGYYPNAGFVHMDVRDSGTGHVAWTDVSRPGQAPRYVTSRTSEPIDSAAPALPALPSHAPDANEADEKLVNGDERAHSI
jgi:Bacterial protein of unknown function (DUF882)